MALSADSRVRLPVITGSDRPTDSVSRPGGVTQPDSAHGDSDSVPDPSLSQVPSLRPLESAGRAADRTAGDSGGILSQAHRLRVVTVPDVAAAQAQ